MMFISSVKLGELPSRILSIIQPHRSTVEARHVPPAFREPFILTGYRRPNQPWSYYWKTLFHVHNESLNVWSHLLATLLILKHVWSFSQTFDLIEDKYGWSLVGFSLGCFFGTLFSAIAHQFHSKSVWWHYVLFMIDYGGVTLYTFGTGIGCMYICSQRYMYTIMEPVFLPLNVFFSWFTFYVCCIAKLKCASTNNGTRYVFMLAALLVYALVISIPIFARYSECMTTPGCSLASLNHLTTCFLLLAICAILFSCHTPERLSPGRFDLVGHGHSLFHLLCLVTVSMQMEGVRVDIKAGAAAHTNPSLGNILTAYAVLMSAEVLTLVSLRGDIAAKAKTETLHWFKTRTKCR
ncbi:membrane progestin receptor alpha-like [Haliotis rubra]|uniref:membrane progestin receptor alpha-like n=1 Tax=Haliotis rubra TaxID=36100 RepID=UPI001EE4F828|nr:membrane progestin receptor alpha-like [Haliotis rubra]XP_046544716.1 membrane progestin receptor alpha-like [Haliotis rubra]XP_046544717.1 membrane progestin receptor alpha-like [Haliotis rubra]